MKIILKNIKRTHYEMCKNVSKTAKITQKWNQRTVLSVCYFSTILWTICFYNDLFIKSQTNWRLSEAKFSHILPQKLLQYNCFKKVYMTRCYDKSHNTGMKFNKCTKLVNSVMETQERFSLMKHKHEGKCKHRRIGATVRRQKCCRQKLVWT